MDIAEKTDSSIKDLNTTHKKEASALKKEISDLKLQLCKKDEEALKIRADLEKANVSLVSEREEMNKQAKAADDAIKAKKELEARVKVITIDLSKRDKTIAELKNENENLKIMLK